MGASLRDKANAALQKGLPIFITEWGATNANGGLDGKVCASEAQAWLDWAKANSISWTAWKLDQGTGASNILRNGAPVTGGWDNWLQGHGSFVRDSIKAP
jgi:endoglucanase